jgi:hypothetical protein
MKWEYKTLNLEQPIRWPFLGGELDVAGIDKQMNRMGQAGWELVSALDTGRGGIRFVVLIFKRPL